MNNEADDPYLINVGAEENGATCTSSSTYGNTSCSKAINYENSFVDTDDEWAANCSLSDCINQFIKISFLQKIVPNIVCLTQRLFLQSIKSFKTFYLSFYITQIF